MDHRHSLCRENMEWSLVRGCSIIGISAANRAATAMDKPAAEKCRLARNM